MERERLETLSFFPHLTREQQGAFLQSAKRVRFAAGEVIYTPEQEKTGMAGMMGMIWVLSGSIRTVMVSETGRKAPLFHLREGQMCVPASSCALASVCFALEATAETDSELLIIPEAVYAGAERENIYVQNFSYRMMADRLADLSESMRQLLFLSLEQRLATYLLEESRQRKSSVLLLTQEQAAESIGSAREAVSRCLKKLKEKGLVDVERGRVELLDKKGLYELTL